MLAICVLLPLLLLEVAFQSPLSPSKLPAILDTFELVFRRAVCAPVRFVMFDACLATPCFVRASFERRCDAECSLTVWFRLRNAYLWRVAGLLSQPARSDLVHVQLVADALRVGASTSQSLLQHLPFPGEPSPRSLGTACG